MDGARICFLGSTATWFRGRSTKKMSDNFKYYILNKNNWLINSAANLLYYGNLTKLGSEPFTHAWTHRCVLKRARKPFVRRCSEFSAWLEWAIRYRTPRVPGIGSRSIDCMVSSYGWSPMHAVGRGMRPKRMYGKQLGIKTSVLPSPVAVSWSLRVDVCDFVPANGVDHARAHAFVIF